MKIIYFDLPKHFGMDKIPFSRSVYLVLPIVREITGKMLRSIIFISIVPPPIPT